MFKAHTLLYHSTLAHRLLYQAHRLVYVSLNSRLESKEEKKKYHVVFEVLRVEVLREAHEEEEGLDREVDA